MFISGESRANSERNIELKEIALIYQHLAPIAILLLKTHSLLYDSILS